MKIGIIGPSNMEYLIPLNPYAEEIISKIAKHIAKLGYDIVLTPDKGSVSEFFAQKYLEYEGNKVYEIVPLDDKEFGFSWVNTELGENINCETWRNQPEKLNEEVDVILCLGYAVGVLAEIAYSKWFKPKKVYILKDLVSGELPEDAVRQLDLEYISGNEYLTKF